MNFNSAENIKKTPSPDNLDAMALSPENVTFFEQQFNTLLTLSEQIKGGLSKIDINPLAKEAHTLLKRYTLPLIFTAAMVFPMDAIAGGGDKNQKPKKTPEQKAQTRANWKNALGTAGGVLYSAGGMTQQGGMNNGNQNAANTGHIMQVVGAVINNAGVMIPQ